MIPVTPRGFKDVLPEEARWRESITMKVQSTLSSWGYAPIETPTLEVLEVLEQGGRLSETPFRLFDSDGALLVLRPDVTLPIARMVASRLSPIVEPLRFRYVQPVFREEESLRGQAREFTQLGIESIGLSGAAADAEVILLMVDALKACGLKEFTIAICTVGVLRDLLDAIVSKGNASEQWRREVLAACHQNNAVEVARLAADARIDERYETALRALLGLRGGAEAIERCRELVEPLGCTDGLDTLAQTYGIIKRVGAAGFVTVDFSVMSAFDYYTGLVFEAYAPRLGVLLGSGGRYDRMLEAYGTKAPAAGFAFNLERVMMALLEQGIPAAPGIRRPDYAAFETDEGDPAEAFLSAARLREAGYTVVLVQTKGGMTDE
ncbi:MAG: ATP phosphoribosyltransferase regulatory subunit [Coriobacteriales bacterium]|nr:ATP phosphoribosyltransferase regulatory subunit [Coriobacteriales bacterium]